jgi:hypothetical protein
MWKQFQASSRKLSSGDKHRRCACNFRIFAAPVDVREPSRGAHPNVEEALPIGLDGEHAEPELARIDWQSLLAARRGFAHDFPRFAPTREHERR